MSDDTLLPSEPSNEEPQEGGVGFLWAEGVAGEGDAPEWYKSDKYKSISDQAKAYTELEKRFGGFVGAPKDGYSLPEEVDSEDTFVQTLKSLGAESNMSQETFSKVLELGESLITAQSDLQKERELEALGENAEERLKNIDGFLRNNLGDNYESLSEAVSSAKVVELVERLIEKTAQPKPSTGSSIPVNVPTQADIDSMMAKTDDRGRQLYIVDESYRNKVRQAMAHMNGVNQFNYVEMG